MGTRRIVWIVAALVAAILIVATIALGPSLMPRAAPGDTRPAPTAVERPTWAVGDTWTYNMTLWGAHDGAETMATEHALMSGILTKRVVGAVSLEDGGSAHNVSVDLALDGRLMSAIEATDHVRIDVANVEGYSWYRTSDLARVADVHTARFAGEINSLSGHLRVSLTVHTETTYAPAWDAWAFPIDEDDSWNVSTTASVSGWSVFRIDGMDHYLELGRNFTFTVPLSYTMMSGAFEEVSTPAGTFDAIRTFPVVPAGAFDIGDDLLTALALHVDAPGIGHASADVWFSAEVGNVVRAEAALGGEATLRLVVVLESFARA